MAYIGNIGDKLTLTVTVKGVYSYTDCSYSYYGTHKNIYSFEDEEGNCYSWNTSSYLEIKSIGGFRAIDKLDKIIIKGEVKAHKEYRGEEQTVLKRVQLVEVLAERLTEKYLLVMKEKILDEKKAEQLASLQEGDMIYQMPYSQYKERYNDCETLAGSFIPADKYDRYSVPQISVIVREGRLVPSGVRFEHYSGYEIHFNLDGKEQYSTYRAVNEENALKRCMKDFPTAENYECKKIYNYRD